MANRVEKESVLMMFSDEELREISGVKRGGDYIEVTCGCTSHRYGDAVGRLRVFSNGDLEITCECTPGCNEDKMTPAAFEKHSGRETARKWKNNVWVIVNGEKVPLSKTVLLKYYNQASKHGNGSHRSHNGRVCHRDEFVRCARCNKERRFRLRTKEECLIHHNALADKNWKCSDLPYDNMVTITIWKISVVCQVCAYCKVDRAKRREEGCVRRFTTSLLSVKHLWHLKTEFFTNQTLLATSFSDLVALYEIFW